MNITRLRTAAENALIELRNIHADMLARTEHAPTGCPCSVGTSEPCPVAMAIDDLKEALQEGGTA